ncbi:MAG: thioredoxin domain-containing protein [Candidatus Kapaibacteriota bacterium]
MADNHSSSRNDSKANALINELSPYLLQHAYNPVEWMPWNDSTFEKAITEQKPVFVSIGYATCHWCHVMEHESFEDLEIAELLNRDFIAIKVDREERPDIDAALMEMCQAMTGHGGWPLTIFMTPEKLPFFAGTYFPKESIPNRIGFKDVLLRIAEGWKQERDAIISSGKEIVSQLSNHHIQSQLGEIPPDIFEKADGLFHERYDMEYAGFGTAPKFPSPHHLIYLLRRAHFTKNEDLAKMAMQTLKNMSLGGMKDHIGYGYHRYSTDKQWLVPHFEKMLYDQAMILQSMTEAWLYSKDEAFKRYAEEIVSYVQSRLAAPHGGWYCAEDADSEGEEGTYYLFTEKELSEILNEDEFNLAKTCFHISPEGNYVDEAKRKLTGKNILSLFLDDSQKTLHGDIYESMRLKCLAYRDKRIPPLLDDKILTDWNALMIQAMSYAGRSFNKTEWIHHAEKAYAFIKETMLDGDILLHRYRNGEASIKAMADDHSFLMLAILELYI